MTGTIMNKDDKKKVINIMEIYFDGKWTCDFSVIHSRKIADGEWESRELNVKGYGSTPDKAFESASANIIVKLKLLNGDLFVEGDLNDRLSPDSKSAETE